MIWASMAALAVLAVLFVLLPLRGARAGEAGDEGDTTPAVLVDQLGEVKRDLDRGLINADEAAAAQLEIKRRIVALSRKSDGGLTLSAGGGRAAVWLAAAFVPLLAAGYYYVSGSPGIASLAFADREAERAETRQVAELTQRLFERLSEDPEGGPTEGWMLLGQTYFRMGRHEDAAKVFDLLTEREDATSATFSMLAEALVMAEQGIVTPRAEKAIDRAMDLDPTNPAASFYKAVALAQTGEEGRAHDLLVARLNAAEGFAPWMEAFIGQANNIGDRIGRPPLSLADFAPAMAAPGPTAGDVAAAEEMSEEDRGAFIRSMVERLAERLENEPEDLDGWLRLGNAYKVLGERDEAISAYERAQTLLANVPADDPRRTTVEQALVELKG